MLGSFTGSNVTIDFNGATLDFSALALASTDTLLMFEGAYSAGVALAGPAAANQKTIAVPSTSFAVGDFVRIYSEKIWDSTRTNTRYGELNFIETVPDAANVALTMELQSTYATAHTAKIEKLTPVRNVKYLNGRIIGPSGNDELRGFRFRLGIDCHMWGMRFEDIDYLHAQLTDCISCTVMNCHFKEANNAATAYGLSFADASCDCLAFGNHFVDVRHSLSTNNNVSNSYGIVRRIRFELNDIRDSAKATGGTGGDAIDTHAGAEDIDIINNTVHSSSGIGINVEAKSARIHGNRVKHTASVGIYFHPYSDEVGNCSIVGNRCEQIGDGSGLDPGILVAVGSVAPSRVEINSNHVESATSEAIRVTGSAGQTLRYLALNGNICQTTNAGPALYLRNVDSGALAGNSVLASAGDTGLLVEDCNFIAVGVNNFKIAGSATNMYGARFIGAGTRHNVVGLTAHQSGAFTNSYGVHFADTITSSGVFCCSFPGITTDFVLGAGSGNVQANNQ
ncbi:MAG: hypothetical protein AB7O64_02850 [Methylibium sp.]